MTSQVLTLNNGKQYKINLVSECLVKVRYNEITDIKKQCDDYILKFNGDLFKNYIKIAENINDMSDTYKDAFICDNKDGILMLYKDALFNKLNIPDKKMHVIHDNYIDIIQNNKFTRLLNDYLTCHNLEYAMKHMACYDFEKIGSHEIIKFGKNITLISNPYILLDDNTLTYGDNCYNIMNTEYDKNDIIDIYSYDQSTTSSIMILLKNSSIDFLCTVSRGLNKEELCFKKNIKLDGQLIKYNGHNIFKINQVHDVLKEIKYLTGDTKKQIHVLLCIMKKYKIPKPLKLMILCYLIT